MVDVLKLDLDTDIVYQKVSINAGPTLIDIVLQWSKFNNQVAISQKKKNC